MISMSLSNFWQLIRILMKLEGAKIHQVVEVLVEDLLE
jgi:hypothetical protein